MEVLVVTEIWGRTRHVEQMVDSLRSSSCCVEVVDPYDGADPDFASEEEAYSAFMEQCGHVEYSRKVTRAVRKATKPLTLIGFSAGAGAVWSTVCNGALGVSEAYCFYGSSIRSMIDCVPSVPVQLIFPEHEPHFDVGGLVKALQDKPHVQCRVVPHGHGFMNPLSDNYDERAYAQWMDWLVGRMAFDSSA